MPVCIDLTEVWSCSVCFVYTSGWCAYKYVLCACGGQRITLDVILGADVYPIL